jgi:excisionase family DNA binding protein
VDTTVIKEKFEKRALTIAEACEYACVSRGTVESWLAKGLLSYEELPGTGSKQRFRRIRKKDLDTFLDQNIKVNKATHRKNETGEQKSIFLLPKST